MSEHDRLFPNEIGARLRAEWEAATVRIAELEAALKDALDAWDVAADKACGCGFVRPEDYDDYKEAEARIEKARALLK